MSTKTPGPTGALTVSSSLAGSQVSRRRNCISSKLRREESPGSPYLPLTLGPLKSAGASTGSGGTGRRVASGGSPSSGTTSSCLRAGAWPGRVGGRECSRRAGALRTGSVATAGVVVVAAPGGVAEDLRRFRPPRRPRLRRFASGAVAVADCTSLLMATMDSNISAFCVNGIPGSVMVRRAGADALSSCSRLVPGATGTEGLIGIRDFIRPDRHFNAQTRGGFHRFRFPVRAAKACGGGGVPFPGIGGRTRSFKMARQFKGHHRVLRLFVKIRQLGDGVFTGTRAPDTSGNLFPISHTLHGIVAAEAEDGQQSRISDREDLQGFGYGLLIDGSRWAEYSFLGIRR